MARPSSSTTSDGSTVHRRRPGEMRARQIAAFIGTTLFKDGRMVAAFGANDVTPRAWTASEIELVRDVAERTWEAVERVRAEAALREREHGSVALEASAGGSWTWVAATNQVDWDDDSALCTVSRPTIPPTAETGHRACMRKIARGCSPCSGRC